MPFDQTDPTRAEVAQAQSDEDDTTAPRTLSQHTWLGDFKGRTFVHWKGKKVILISILDVIACGNILSALKGFAKELNSENFWWQVGWAHFIAV